MGRALVWTWRDVRFDPCLRSNRGFTPLACCEGQLELSLLVLFLSPVVPLHTLTTCHSYRWGLHPRGPPAEAAGEGVVPGVCRVVRTTTPSADSCPQVGGPCGPPSPDTLGAADRSPEVSSTAFDARPPDLRFAFLMDMGFARVRPLAQRSRLTSGFCSSTRVFASPFFQTPPHDNALGSGYPSPPSGWTGTFTRSCRTCSANVHTSMGKMPMPR